ncbi:MAG: glutathione transferase GstA [Myxococcaceae bacterium]
MMKLYFAPGACSFAPHIALRESGLEFDLERVDLRTHVTENGANYYDINPKGYVPALRLDDGQILTECAAVLQYIADLAPAQKLAPAAGTLARYRAQEWLHFIATEIHKSFGPMFNPATTPEAKAQLVERISNRFGHIARQLEGKPYLMGEDFTVADAYLFTMFRWSTMLGPDLAQWASLKAYFDRVSARPAVQAALAAEGAR